ncbi:MAG: aspartate kinase [Bacteroidia bacterium]
MNISVHKFGGASLSEASLIKNVAEIIRRQSRPAIAVVSAMGKTTNALEKVVKAKYFNTENPNDHLNEIKKYHSSIIHHLFENTSPDKISQVETAILPYWQYAEHLIAQPLTYSYGQLYDQIVSVGELVSSTIVSEFLNTVEIYNTLKDIRKILVTDTQWRSANVDISQSQKNFDEQWLPLIHEQSLILTQGFIGSTVGGYTTTLGREGSDYTAALLASFVNAREVTIWKDVEGVLNADPRYFKNPQKIDELSYYDAIEMTYYGATVIHPKTIKPLQNKNIPLKVKSFYKPDKEGTIIHQSERVQKITTYSYLPNQILISVQSQDYSFITETHIGQIFDIINAFNVKLNLMQNTALNFSICTNYDDIITPSFVKELQKHFKVLFNTNVAILNIRHYTPSILNMLVQGKEILLEQRTRNHVQLVIREN